MTAPDRHGSGDLARVRVMEEAGVPADRAPGYLYGLPVPESVRGAAAGVMPVTPAGPFSMFPQGP
ncbi:hypothetical protein CK489_31510 [Bradyrhizobium sp. UFLA03-84]|nr:hypothetical protein CK489_31510 [Bradyrhizobium sp. UFLA03-84]